MNRVSVVNGRRFRVLDSAKSGHLVVAELDPETDAPFQWAVVKSEEEADAAIKAWTTKP